MLFTAFTVVELAVGLLLLTVLLSALTFWISYRREKFRNKRQQLAALISATITTYLLSAENERGEVVAADTHLLMQQKFNRGVMANALVTARKSVSGKAGQAVIHLYEQLGLPADAAKRLRSRQWHIRAGAVQELSIMQQKTYWKQIYKLTNHANEHLRREAQAGVVRLLGFSGLRFLRVTTHYLTEWQQINLLHLLRDIPVHDFQGMDRWLLSQNPSVIVFTLKLATKFRRYELINEITTCLQHTFPAVRMQAAATIRALGIDEVTSYSTAI